MQFAFAYFLLIVSGRVFHLNICYERSFKLRPYLCCPGGMLSISQLPRLKVGRVFLGCYDHDFVGFLKHSPLKKQAMDSNYF